MEKNSDSDPDNDIQTMVVSLGSRFIKAAYSGEKTCRYVSEKVHIRPDSEDKVLVEPGPDTIPILDTLANIINHKHALISALLLCWSEQYTDKLQPHQTRLVLAVASTDPSLLDELGTVAFDDLAVLKLCILTPGEAVSLYEGAPSCVVLDIGYRVSRLEVFVDWVMVDREEVTRGGCNVEGNLTDTGNDEIIFKEDSCGKTIPAILEKFLKKFENISTVIVTGSTSFRFTPSFMSAKCLDHTGNNLKISYRLAPERNKSSWLGASIVPELSCCQHRFYEKEQWRMHPEYVQLLIPESKTL